MRRFSHRKKKINLSKSNQITFTKVLIALFFLIILLSIFLSLKLGVFNIKKTEINLSNNLTCASLDQLKNISNLTGQNFFFINSSQVIKNIKDNFICVKGVNLWKLFPGRVKLEVIGREPIVRLSHLSKEASLSASLENIATPSAEQSLDDTYLADDEVIFAKGTDHISIPVIYLQNFNLAVGKKIDDLIKFSLNILQNLENLGLKIQITQIIDNFFIIFPTTSQPKIIFHLGKDINSQIASLQLILKKAKIDEENLEFIDLRFDKPVVKFAPKKK